METMQEAGRTSQGGLASGVSSKSVAPVFTDHSHNCQNLAKPSGNNREAI